MQADEQAAVDTHNTRVTAEIAEILGQIQFQDVARQRIERIADAVAKRNHVFQAFAQGMNATDAGFHLQMRDVLEEYLLIKSCHGACLGNASGQDENLPKFELF